MCRNKTFLGGLKVIPGIAYKSQKSEKAMERFTLVYKPKYFINCPFHEGGTIGSNFYLTGHFHQKKAARQPQASTAEESPED